MTETETTSCLEWGWAGAALESVSGDLHVVVPFPGGVLVALLDGLGHGVEAALASQAAVPILEEHPSESVDDLVRRCHAALRKTRGAVMSLASVREREGSLTWIGVGNVDAVLLRAAPSHDEPDAWISGRGGVVGSQLPTLRPVTIPLRPGDTLVLATDGVRTGYTHGLVRTDSADCIAASILARYARPTDDAHVVVARYVGRAS